MKIDLLDTKVGGFNYEFLRAISYQKTEGAELGECVAVAARIHEGDFDWLEETFSRKVPASGEGKFPETRIPTRLLPLLEKYHGKEVVRDLQGLDLFRNQGGSSDE